MADIIGCSLRRRHREDRSPPRLLCGEVLERLISSMTCTDGPLLSTHRIRSVTFGSRVTAGSAGPRSTCPALADVILGSGSNRHGRSYRYLRDTSSPVREF